MRRILIYGNSILLAGLAAQLRNAPDVQLLCREMLANLGDLAAFYAVIVDLNDGRAGDILALLRARPDLPVIGINAATSALTVLSGQVYLAQTVDDVVAHLARRMEKEAAME